MTSEAYDNGTVRLRLTNLEDEQKLQRTRIHDLGTEQAGLRLMIQRNTDKIEELADDVSALKRAFYTFTIGTVGSAIIFAFSVFALLGRH